MGTQHSHSHSHQHSKKQNNHQILTDPTHNHQQPNDKQHRHHNQPIQQRKILKDSIILPQYGGQVTIDKLSKVIVRKIQVFDFQRQFVQAIVTKRMLLKHPNFITVKNYSFESLSDNKEFDSRTDIQKSLYFCYPNSQILRIEFDPAILHVHGLILQHCQKRMAMEQSEIRRILGAVLDCLIYLKHNGTFHGDIKPTTIFMNPKTQVVQLVDSFFVTNGRTSFQMVNQNPSCKSYLTPQQLDKKRKKTSDSLQKIYQSEVFCLGLTLLQMMTFQQSMKIYQLDLLEIRKEFIDKKVFEMQDYGYSQELATLALSCLHKDPSKRPTHEKIKQRLQGPVSCFY